MSKLDKFFERMLKELDKKGAIDLDRIDISIETLKTNVLATALPPSEIPKGELPSAFSMLEHSIPAIPPTNFTPIEEVIFRRSNGNEVRVGGDRVLPYYSFMHDNKAPLINPNPPKVTFDVFDMKIKLPKVIKNVYREVLKNPPEWARMAEKFGADLITLHFVSTDPGVKDSPVSKAVKVLEEVLQAVKIPIIIGGSGNKKKDTELFEACASVTEGERLMLSSADKITWDKVVPIARKYGHNVLLWAQLDINDQMKLVEDALSMGMPRNQIILDPTCATLGYGLEYSFSIYQRFRLAGLKGDKSLNFPLSAGTTNAWGGREAWMKKLGHMPGHGGDRALRGPLWEIITALTMSLNGMNLAMMLHPLSAQTFKELILEFHAAIPDELPPFENWVSAKY